MNLETSRLPSENRVDLAIGRLRVANLQKEENAMTYIPTQTGFMQLQDSARLLREVFPHYPELQPCNPVPVLEATAAASAASVYL